MSSESTLDLVVRALGWALLHSVWQGALVAAVVALLLSSLKGRSAHARYVVACLGLAAMVAAWIGTALFMNSTLEPRLRVVVAQPAPVELGPAGPSDRTPAIRVLASADALERVATPSRPWRERLESWSWALVPLWFVGVVVFSTRLAAAWVGLRRLRRATMSPVPDAVLDRAATLMRRLGIRRAVGVVQSAMVQVPLVVGWLRPVVMLPASALSGLSPAQLESIIAHELAHVRRHDYLVNVLQSVAEALLYYHPACWWISRRIRVEREHCCDDIAVALCGDGVTYATALADLESRRAGATFALAASDGPLLQRVRRVIAPASDAGPASWAGSLAPVVLMLVLLAGAQAAGRAALAESQATAPTMSRTVPAGEAVLQGRVVEANSARPVVGARVTVMGPSAAETKTNDDGRFELSGLKPGSYTLHVRAKGFVETYYGRNAAAVMDFGARVTATGGRVTSGLDVRLESAGSLGGRIIDAKGAGIPGVEVELVREQRTGGFAPAGGGFAQTVADGSYRMTDVVPGDYVVRAYTGRDARHTVDGVPVVYTATFYPGVADVDSAQRLRLYAGQELLDVDFMLATSRLFQVAGTLLDPNGQASGLGVILHPMAPSGLPGGEYKASVDQKGGFRIPGVVPGRYMLDVTDPRKTMRWVSTMKTLTVDADVTDLELRAELGASVEGRVVRDVGATATLDPTAVYVGFTKRIEGQSGGFTGSSFPTGSDGAFTLESPGGPTSFSVKRMPKGWMVKSVSLDGAEIDDGPIDFGTGRRQVEVVLTDKVSGVSGVVVDRNGRPLTNYSVVLFPPDPLRWHQDSRFLAMARSDNDGRFNLEAVPPGTYLAVAVPALPMGSWQDRSVLEKLQSSAETIRVGEGQRLTISIRASPTPDGLAKSHFEAPVALLMGCRSNQAKPCGV